NDSIQTGRKLQKSALMERVMQAIPGLYQGYAPNKDLQNAIWDDYNKEDGAITDIDALAAKYKKAAAIDAFKQFEKTKDAGFLDYFAPIAALGLPLLTEYINNGAAGTTTDGISGNIAKWMDKEGMEKWNMGVRVNLLPGDKSTPRALFAKLADGQWSESEFQELFDLLKLWEDVKDDAAVATAPFSAEDFNEINSWINNRGTGPLMLSYINANIPAKYGVSQLDKNLQNSIKQKNAFTVLTDIDMQTKGLYGMYEKDIDLSVLKQICEKENDPQAKDDSLRYATQRAVRLAHIRELLTIINSDKNDLKYYTDAQAKDIMDSANKILEKEETKDLKKVAGARLVQLEYRLSDNGYRRNDWTDYQLLTALAQNDYDADAAFNTLTKKSAPGHADFVSPLQITTKVRTALADLVSDQYSMSSGIEESMLKWIGDNSADSNGVPLTQAQIIDKLIENFAADIVIDALGQYRAGNIILFKEAFMPAILTVSRFLPFNWGAPVVAAANLAEFLSPGVSGRNLHSKINSMGHIVGKDGNDVMAAFLQSLGSQQELDLKVFKEKDVKKLIDWVGKKEKTIFIDQLSRNVEGALGVSGLVEFDLKKVIKDFGFDPLTLDRSGDLNAYLQRYKGPIALHALEKLLDSKGLSNRIVIFNAIAQTKTALEGLYPDASLRPRNITKALAKAERALNGRQDIVDKKTAFIQSQGVQDGKEEIISALKENNYDVDKTITSLKGDFSESEIPEGQRISNAQHANDFLNNSGVNELYYRENSRLLNIVKKYHFRLIDLQEAKELSSLRLINAALDTELAVLNADFSGESAAKKIDGVISRLAESVPSLKDLQKPAVNFPSRLEAPLKNFSAAYEAFKARPDQSTYYALTSAYMDLRADMKLLRDETSGEISKALDSPLAYTDMHLLKEKTKEFIRLERMLLAVEGEIKASKIMPAENRTQTSYSPSSAFQTAFDRFASLFKAKDYAPNILENEITANITSQDKTDAKNELNKALTAQLPVTVTPADLASIDHTAAIKDYALQKAQAQKSGKPFNKEQWAKNMARDYARAASDLILNKRVVDINNGNGASLTAEGVKDMYALSAYIRFLSGRTGIAFTAEEAQLLQAAEEILTNSEQAVQTEKETADAIVENGEKLNLFPSGLNYKGQMSRLFQMDIVRNYYGEFISRWAQAADFGNVTPNLISRYQESAKNATVRDYKNDILLDGFNQASLFDPLSAATQDFYDFWKSTIKRQKAQGINFSYFDESDLAASMTYAGDAKETASEDVKDEYLLAAQQIVTQDNANFGLLYKVFESELQAQRGRPLNRKEQLALRDFIRVLISANVSYEYKYGQLSLSAMTDLERYSINFTATADLKKIYEDLTKKGKAEREKREQEEAAKRTDNMIGKAVFQALKDTLGNYLPDFFAWTDISVNLQNDMIKDAKSQFTPEQLEAVQNAVRAEMKAQAGKDLTEDELNAKLVEAADKVLKGNGDEAAPSLAQFALSTAHKWSVSVLFSALDTYARRSEQKLPLGTYKTQNSDATDFTLTAGNILSGLGRMYSALPANSKDRNTIQTNFDAALTKIADNRYDANKITKETWTNGYEQYFKNMFEQGKQEVVKGTQLPWNIIDVELKGIFGENSVKPDPANEKQFFEITYTYNGQTLNTRIYPYDGNSNFVYSRESVTHLRDTFNSLADAGFTSIEWKKDPNGNWFFEADINGEKDVPVYPFNAKGKIDTKAASNAKTLAANRKTFKEEHPDEIGDIRIMTETKENGTVILWYLTADLTNNGAIMKINSCNDDGSIKTPGELYKAFEDAHKMDVSVERELEKRHIIFERVDSSEGTYYKVWYGDNANLTKNPIAIYPYDTNSNFAFNADNVEHILETYVNLEKYGFTGIKWEKDADTGYYCFSADKDGVTDAMRKIYPFNDNGIITGIAQKTMDLFTKRKAFADMGYTITAKTEKSQDGSIIIYYEVVRNADSMPAGKKIYPVDGDVVKSAAALKKDFDDSLVLSDVEKTLKDIFGQDNVSTMQIETIDGKDAIYYEVKLSVSLKIKVYPYDENSNFKFNAADLTHIRDTYTGLTGKGFTNIKWTQDTGGVWRFEVEKYSITDTPVYPFRSDGNIISDIVEKTEKMYYERDDFAQMGFTITARTAQTADGDTMLVYDVVRKADGRTGIVYPAIRGNDTLAGIKTAAKMKEDFEGSSSIDDIRAKLEAAGYAIIS
ncbi:MAG: hypothetical protein LBL00_08180, partial [Endomicrobium sp.]|nr:hypothetical protein [Endomicrobium sp.]